MWSIDISAGEAAFSKAYHLLTHIVLRHGMCLLEDLVRLQPSRPGWILYRRPDVSVWAVDIRAKVKQGDAHACFIDVPH
jgi:hypothetical protein